MCSQFCDRITCDLLVTSLFVSLSLSMLLVDDSPALRFHRRRQLGWDVDHSECQQAVRFHLRPPCATASLASRSWTPRCRPRCNTRRVAWHGSTGYPTRYVGGQHSNPPFGSSTMDAGARKGDPEKNRLDLGLFVVNSPKIWINQKVWMTSQRACSLENGLQVFEAREERPNGFAVGLFVVLFRTQTLLFFFL